MGVPTIQMSPGCGQITSRFRDCAVSNVINSQRWGYRRSRLEREEVEATLGPYKPAEGKLLHTHNVFPLLLVINVLLKTRKEHYYILT